jgi:hypothetical protein
MSIRRAALLPAILSIAIAACSTGSGSSNTTTTGTSSTTASSTPSASTGAAATTKVSANTATESELVAALTAAGVPNADRWAREVMEYRPYPADDATLQKLQDNLAKYNPDSATLAAILAALEP